MTRSRIEALQRTAMFGAINEETILLLLERAKVVEVAAGEYYFQEGERGNSAYLLEAGEITVLKEWGNERHVLRRLAAGDCFGEVALLDFGKRSASILADVDTRALTIHIRDHGCCRGVIGIGVTCPAHAEGNDGPCVGSYEQFIVLFD